MAKVESLGIKRLEAIHYYVRDLERSRRFYGEKMDFAEVGESGAELTRNGRQKSLVFEAGACTVICSAPEGDGGRAARYLKKHPDGIGTLVMEVEDIKKTFALLEAREGTPITDIERFEDDGGWLETFNITTPFGDTTFRFVQREGFRTLFPGMVVNVQAKGGKNRFGFTHFDHVTSNFQTMAPALLWMEHVLGFERFWDVEFHTDDVGKGRRDHGSGLRSVVMWDPSSGVKFANNEPFRPHFKASQINIFNEDHRGDGVQHVALGVGDILGCVRGLRARGVEFMPTPGTYYDMLPERLARIGVEKIDEDVETLRELEVLVDGAENRSYLLQIFLKDSAGLYNSPEAGPFFYEIIHRKGDQGFGAGNFRALFESIERQQKAEGRA
jgi:4-hydroxyphenylpyruvate dioxygenase